MTSQQRFEHVFLNYHTQESLQSAADGAAKLTRDYAERGYELVSSSMTCTQVASEFKRSRGGSVWTFEYSILCSMKRPVAP
jgi:hypothetical protein